MFSVQFFHHLPFGSWRNNSSCLNVFTHLQRANIAMEKSIQPALSEKICKSLKSTVSVDTRSGSCKVIFYPSSLILFPLPCHDNGFMILLDTVGTGYQCAYACRI